MVHFHIKRIINILGNHANISNYVAKGNINNRRAMFSFIKTFAFIAILFLVGYIFELVVPQKTREIKFFEDMEQFIPNTQVNIQRASDKIISTYYSEGKYKYVVDLCEVNITNLDYHERAMYAFSCMETDRIKEAVNMLRIISQDENDYYREQAEYCLAYLLFKYGDTEAPKILLKIMKDKDHTYRKQAIELYNHPTMNELKKRRAEKNLTLPEAE